MEIRTDQVAQGIAPWSWPRRVQMVATILTATIGMLVLIGWGVKVDTLTRLRPDFVAMNPTTALGFLLCGVGLWTIRSAAAGRVQNWAQYAVGSAIGLIGGVALFRTTTGSGPRIDQWFVPADAVSSMAPNTAVLFALAGAAIVLMDRRVYRNIWAGEAISVVIASLSMLALCGYLYGAGSLYGVGAYIPMSLPTAAGFVAVAAGILCARSHRPVMSQFLSSRPGGTIARRALPGTALIVLGAGYLRQLGEARGVYGSETGVAIMASLTIVLVCAMVLWIGASLDRMDAAREQLVAQTAQSRKAIAEKHELLTAVLNNIADGVMVVDASGTLLHANPAATMILGPMVSQGGLLWTGGDSLRRDVDGEIFPVTELALVRAMNRETVLEQEQYLQGGKGANGKWLSVSAQPLGLTGGSAVVMIRDITSRKLAERKLEDANVMLEAVVAERTANLERSNQDLQQFAYVASHDLQEPLRMVGSYLQLLERRYKDKLDDQGREFIGYAVDGANRMKQLIVDLLHYSRVESRGGVFAAMDSTQAVKDARQSLAAAITASSAEIVCEDLPAITADPVQMRQLFQNLIGNAVKFRAEEPPRITIRAARLEKEWKFSVTDNGIGIEPQYAERIFEVFQRLHTREKYAGTGIGLAICKKIVERHGGRIWVEAGVGGGSTFAFTIPDKEPSHELRRAA